MSNSNFATDKHFDCVILGAGAAGLMCAIEAGKRGRKVLVIDQSEKPAQKIRISGGGRCNFTNMNTGRGHFLSRNPKFALSALNGFTPRHFLDLVEAAGIKWVDKAEGQLFCEDSAQNIIDMLLEQLRETGGTLALGQTIEIVRQSEDGFRVTGKNLIVTGKSLVVATGGKSIPKMGATPFGYKLAEQFGLRLIETYPGLVPLTFDPGFKEKYVPLAGVSVDAKVTCKKTSFSDSLLFTHRGLSGPAILQISSFWVPGDALKIDLVPTVDVPKLLEAERATHGKRTMLQFLSELVPKRLADVIAQDLGLTDVRLADLSAKKMMQIEQRLKHWVVKPTGSEGYRTAEVTCGGVDTRDLDGKTMMTRDIENLFFIGEVVDVTGWLGGYNFQWAWSSGYAAGQVC